jgi:hypothetical protein
LSDPAHETARRIAFGPPPVVSPALKVLAVVMLVLPILGLAANLAIWRWAPEWIVPYWRGKGMHAVIVLASINMTVAFFHRRRTKMRTAFAAQLLSLAWLASFVFLLTRWMKLAAPDE